MVTNEVVDIAFKIVLFINFGVLCVSFSVVMWCGFQLFNVGLVIFLVEFHILYL